MRIQMILIGSTGDVQPMVLLGEALQKKGHEVSVAAFSAFQGCVESAGLGFRPLPGDAERFIGSIIQPGKHALSYLPRLLEALDHMVTPLFDAIFSYCQDADAMLCTFFGNIPHAMAKKLRIPFIEVCYCPMYPTGENSLPILSPMHLGKHYHRATYQLAHFLIRQVEKRYLYAWCEEKGIDPQAASARTRLILNAYSAHLAKKPADWSDNMRLVGFIQPPPAPYAPSEALQRFLTAGDTPVYIGFGSMTSGDTQKTVCAVQAAVENLGIRAVIAPGWSGLQADTLPENLFLLEEYVPHDWIFAKVRAVIHHGGAGTTCAGLCAGKPTLVIPFGSDQYFWGSRVQALGCGPKALPYTKLTGKRLTKKIQDLLETPRYAKNAKALAALLQKEDAVQDTVTLIEEKLQGFKKAPQTSA